MAKVPSRSYGIRYLVVYPILGGYVFAAGAIAAALFSLPFAWVGRSIEPVLSIVPCLLIPTQLILFPLTAVFVHSLRVAVSPDFIWCPNLWGNLVPISWQSIRTVRKVIFPGFPAYVLESTDRRGVLFVPRFLTDFEEFVEKVEEYGGCDNQLYKAVWPAAEQNSV